jgi:transposase
MAVDRWCVVAGDLTDQEWERLEPLLPSMAFQRGGRWRDHRQVINGILWRVENGAKWEEVPDRYGPGKTCYDRFSRWEQDGTWAKIEQQLQACAVPKLAAWPVTCGSFDQVRRLVSTG